MNETNVKTVKKIKKVVATNIQTTDNQLMGEVKEPYTTTPIVKKVKKIIKKEIKHKTEGDTEIINVNVLAENSVEQVEINVDLKNDEETDETVDCDFSEFEEDDCVDVGTTKVLMNQLEKECEEENNVDNNDCGEQIMFTKVTDLDPNKYKDFFTKEKFKYGLLFYDFEIFEKDFIVTFVDVMNYKETVIVNDRKAFLKFYMQHKDEIWCGYNSRSYDSTIAKAIILGMNPKEVSDALIVKKLKAFQINDKFKEIQLLDFDIMTLNRSLKQLEAFMGHDIRETEVPFNLPRVLNAKEIEQTIFYNKHDVYETIEVFKRKYGVYEANIGIVEMFEFPITDISKTQAQLTAKIVECKKPQESREDDWDFWLVDGIDLGKYQYIADWFLSLKNDHDRDRIEYYKDGKFLQYKGKDAKKEGYELHVDICGVPHICALGGLHGCPKEPIYVKKEKSIYHSDVNSLYPSICIVYDLLSRNCQKPEKFVDIYNKRIQYKKEKNPLNKILKVPLNANFGIMGDKNSPAYDIRNCRMVCMTGQLLMITLLSKLENYITLIQSNTDGIIYTINNDSDYDTVMKIIHDWEEKTHLGFTTDTIDWIEQGQVNGYAFQFSNGEYERKGDYLKEKSDLDNDLPISNEAMFEYIAHGTNIEDYVNSCDDLIKFQKVVKVSSNYLFATHNGEKFTNKCYRVFATKNKNENELLKWKYPIGTVLENVNSKGEKTRRKYEGEKFANTPQHCFICNEDIVGKKCSDIPNFDKQWYIDLIYDRLKEQFHIDCKPTLFDMF